MADVKNIDLAFSSEYSTPTANHVITLYDGKLEIEHNKTKISPDGIIELVWFRNPHIKIWFTDSNPNFSQDIFAKVAFLHLPKSIKPIKFSLLSFKLRKDNRWECSGEVKEPICLGNGQNLSYVILHLANFQDTLGKSTGTLHKRWSGRFCLNANGWNVTVDNVEDHELLYKSLKASGGYGITHLIKIEKQDGSSFNIEEICTLKEELFYFFSFARGFWTEPFLEIGFDENNNQIWEKWSAPETDRWQSVPSWFDEDHPERLSVFWLSFSKQIEDTTWGETLKRGIRWYISGNLKAGGLEGSIILAQTAHEMLSWTKFVSEKRSFSANKFYNLFASEKLRLILSEAKIPLQIPNLLKFLSHFCSSGNWADGVEAIIAIRNKLVHPSPKNIQTLQQIGIDEMYDAHTLTMWYLELVLLFLLGYKDEYVNRLIYSQQAGQTEPVPWS